MAGRAVCTISFLGVLAFAATQAPRAVHFVDAATALGITEENTFGGRDKKTYILETTGNGALVFDYNNDGANDLLIANGSRLEGADRKPHLYRNEGGKFSEVGAEAGLTRSGWGQAACAGDLDNDGFLDLLLTYYGTNALYRNNGNGGFNDISRQAGLPTDATRWGAACAFLDYNRDGRLDFFVSSYVALDLKKTPRPGEDKNCEWKGIEVMCGPRGLPGALNSLYRNDGNGVFRDVSEAAGINKPGVRYGLGIAVADFDNDGWPDIYVACDMTPSLLFRNQKNGTFAEAGVEAGVAYNVDGRLQAGMGVAVTDFDGNGYLDLVKTNFSGDLPSLYQNEDGRFFSDISREAGLGAHQLLGWGVAFLDADEDGRKDIVMANGHVYPEVDRASVGDRYRQKTLLYRNLGSGKFQDLTAQAGPGLLIPRPARGLALGDLDGDGRPEVIVVNMNEKPSVLKNTAPGGHWINVKLRGIASNRSAIGARVTMVAGGVRQIEEVAAGGSFFSQHDLTLHFGLGESASVSRLEVRWPAGAVQEWSALPSRHLVELTEGESKPTLRAYRK